MVEKGILTFFCGKMGAGKSTLSQKIAKETAAILISEDEWLAALYPNEVHNLEDYLRYSALIKPLLKNHVQYLLRYGVPVVMDFPANTLEQRAWFKSVFSEHGYPHRLIYIDVDDELCLQHIKMRRESCPERRHFDTEEVFRSVNRFFHPPSDEEDFSVEVRSC